MNLRTMLLGRRLANRESEERKLGAFEGIPAMGLDGLGSSAYGPEAALSAMIVLGAASHRYIGLVMAPILVLLAVLFASYWQTTQAYPTNGGAYTVAKENLGTGASLLAAAALMVDYVLNVAVGISAGVGALVSAVPSLHAHILPLCLGILAVIALMNLRGTLDAGRAFALPTYLFVASFGAIILLGLWRAWTSGGAPAPVIAPPPMGEAQAAVSAWILLRAFASGCTAMTGVEAVSNGMSAFKEPRIKHGHRTLAGIVLILGFLLAGIAYLATSFGIGAMDQSRDGYRSVLSQLAAAVAGDSWLYFVGMGSLLCVLCLSANTSMVDFPRLCRLVAADGFLPKPFAIAGRRLVFSVGILYLTAAAGALLILFGGITDQLIPLFAIGAFLTFTLSQTSMVLHWRRELRRGPAPGVHLKLAVNGLGAVTTAAALAIIVVAKFAEGAWITILALPLVIALLLAIRRYYAKVEASLKDRTPIELQGLAPPIVLVLIEEWNQLADRALRFALTISPDVVGLHLADLSGPHEEGYSGELEARWRRNVVAPALKSNLRPPRLVVRAAQYRAMHEPVLRLARELQLEHPDRDVAVLVPELVEERWFQHLLHAHRARRLRRALLRFGGTRLTVVNVPWYLEQKELAQPVVPT